MRRRGTEDVSPRAECALIPDDAGPPQFALAPDRAPAIVWDEFSAGVRRVSFTRVSRAASCSRRRF